MNKENLDWFKKLTVFCDNNNIWYSVAYGTMIGVARHKGSIPWDDDFDIFMKPDGYEKLKSVFPKNCLDSNTNNKYPVNFPKFVLNINDMLNSTIFVDIFIIIPSTKTRAMKFTSWKNRTSHTLQLLQSSWKPYSWKGWLAKFLSLPTRPFIKRPNYQNIVHQLSCTLDDMEFYMIINSPSLSSKFTQIDQLSFQTIDMQFENFNVKVAVEYDAILTHQYGDYMTPIEHRVSHRDIISIKKFKEIK